MNQPQKPQNSHHAESPTTDARTDQVLDHLNSAQPDAGLNDRLLHRLTQVAHNGQIAHSGQVAHSKQIAHSEQVAHSGQIVISTEGAAAVERPAVLWEAHAASVPASTRLRSALPAQAKFLWPLALSGAAAVVLAILALQSGHPLSPARPNHAQSEGATSTNLATQPPRNPSPEGPEPANPNFSSATQPLSSTQPSVAPRTGSQPLRSIIVTTQNPTSPNSEEAKALDDLHARSQPAPPLPLTAQEKAILHLLHRDGTVELAQLDPAVQTKLFALQRADLQRFFDPPPPPKLESEGETK